VQKVLQKLHVFDASVSQRRWFFVKQLLMLLAFVYGHCSSRFGWAGLVAHLGEVRNVHKMLGRKSK
jgi:hypothetical protein